MGALAGRTCLACLYEETHASYVAEVAKTSGKPCHSPSRRPNSGEFGYSTLNTYCGPPLRTCSQSEKLIHVGP